MREGFNSQFTLCCRVLCVCTQVDNHLPDGLYPVLVSKREDEDSSRHGGSGGGGGTRGKAKDGPVPFLQLSVIKEVNQATNTAHFDYVAFRWGGVGWGEPERDGVGSGAGKRGGVMGWTLFCGGRPDPVETNVACWSTFCASSDEQRFLASIHRLRRDLCGKIKADGVDEVSRGESSKRHDNTPRHACQHRSF